MGEGKFGLKTKITDFEGGVSGGMYDGVSGGIEDYDIDTSEQADVKISESAKNIAAARQNPITQGRLEGALGVASQGRPARDHTGRDLSGLDPSDMNWNDVQALRSHDSAANRQKLAEWEASSKLQMVVIRCNKRW